MAVDVTEAGVAGGEDAPLGLPGMDEVDAALQQRVADSRTEADRLARHARELARWQLIGPEVGAAAMNPVQLALRMRG